MKAVEIIGSVEEHHRLVAHLPEGIPRGPVRLIVLVPEEDDGNALWPHLIAREWQEELADPHQDIYTLDDGQPVDATR